MLGADYQHTPLGYAATCRHYEKTAQHKSQHAHQNGTSECQRAASSQPTRPPALLPYRSPIRRLPYRRHPRGRSLLSPIWNAASPPPVMRSAEHSSTFHGHAVDHLHVHTQQHQEDKEEQEWQHRLTTSKAHVPPLSNPVLAYQPRSFLMRHPVQTKSQAQSQPAAPAPSTPLFQRSHYC